MKLTELVMVTWNRTGAWCADDEGPDLSAPVQETDVSAWMVCCLNRHLAVAATQLARAEGLAPEKAARYAAAGARFRALVEQEGDLRHHTPLAPPVVGSDSGAAITLVSLLSVACRRGDFMSPPRSIDPELVHEAKELLCAQPWTLPDQPLVPVS